MSTRTIVCVRNKADLELILNGYLKKNKSWKAICGAKSVAKFYENAKVDHCLAGDTSTWGFQWRGKHPIIIDRVHTKAFWSNCDLHRLPEQQNVLIVVDNYDQIVPKMHFPFEDITALYLVYKKDDLFMTGFKKLIAEVFPKSPEVAPETDTHQCLKLTKNDGYTVVNIPGKQKPVIPRLHLTPPVVQKPECKEVQFTIEALASEESIGAFVKHLVHKNDCLKSAILQTSYSDTDKKQVAAFIVNADGAEMFGALMRYALVGYNGHPKLTSIH